MSDGYPEFPTFLLRKHEDSRWLYQPKDRSRTMKNDTSTAEADTDTDEAPATAPKPKKAKAKTKKAAAKAPAKKAKANGKEKKAERAPRTRDPAKLDEFGFRKGTIKSRAAAMYKKGATLAEVKDEVGSVQFNLLTELEKNGHTIKKTTIKGTGGRDATKYKVTPKSK